MEIEKPNWKTTFKDFPPIPKPKQWSNNTTEEQIITQKLISGESISEDERKTLKICIDYYNQLLPRFKSLDYTKLNINEQKELIVFIDYVFNYITLSSNELYVSKLYRLVINEDVLGKKEKIREQKYLSYPPIEIVQSLGKYNRANTPDYNLFYSTDSIDNALLEIKPQKYSVVTIGVWIPKKGTEVTMTNFPVSHNPYLFRVNPHAARGYFALEELKRKQKDPLLSDFMKAMFTFISEEFAKPVTHHLEYLISSRFADKILNRDQDPNDKFNYHCIIYPSVGNLYQVDNVAIKPDFFDENFKLEKVIEFEITQPHYDKTPPRNDQEEITVVEYKDREETDWIENNGYIVW